MITFKEFILEGLRIAALHTKTGNIIIGEPGEIHPDLTNDFDNHEMGFVTPEGKFLNRANAVKYALKNKDVLRSKYKTELPKYKVKPPLMSHMIKGGSV